MSYILDALKRSDHERSRERGPTLASVHGGWQAPTPWIRRHGGWLVAASLMGLLAAGGAWWMASSLTGSPPGQIAAPAAPDAALPQATVPEAGSGRIERRIDDSAAVEPPRPDPVEPPAPAAPQPRAIQELWELPDPVRAAFPALTFSFHVYADTPARRTIIINGRRYSEGDTLNPETRLEEITEQGVILRFRDYRVYIPIVNDW